MELVVVLVILAALAGLVLSNVDRTTEDAEISVASVTLHTLREAITGSASAPGYLSDMKYIPEFRSVNIRSHDLLSNSRYPDFGTFDPVSKRGWRGPYIRNVQSVANTKEARIGRFPASDERRFTGDETFQERGFYYTGTNTSPYGQADDLAVADPWGNPIVIQVPPNFSSPPDDAMRFRYARLVSAGPDGELTTPLDDLFAGLPRNGLNLRGDDLVLFLNRADIYEE